MSGGAPDAERWARIEEVFAGAVEREGAGRARWLDAECAGDAALRAEVESLLAAHEAGGTVPSLDEPGTAEGGRIGVFRLIEPIGSGGMGTVFLAEREGPDFVQRVALKLIRSGRRDPSLAERLRAERRILARLEHPNIARLIDGGVTAEGQPYFAMEYVQGTDLPTYCDAKRLTVRERLRLFLRVCDAVQHAHGQLVVHRDLKPSNILVTDDGHPKLLDFGIAKVVDPEDDTSSTRSGAWVTPAYASPEQVRGEPAGTASDVYALGVLLYELIAGRRPYELDGRPPAEAQRIICEDQPTRPSLRFATSGTSARIAAARSLPVDRLRRDLEGDLDTIVLKAMAKEPARRYASAAALGDELRRHLDGRPVSARPDSVGYRATRFVLRHRAAVAAAALALLALVAGTTVAVWQASRATEQARMASAERDRAQGEARKAQVVAGLMAELFRLNDPSQALGDTITARQVLDEGAGRIDRELSEQPDMQASLFAEVARVYANLGLLDRADSLARRSLELRTSLYGPESPETAESLGLVGAVYSALGRSGEAIEALRRAIAIREGTMPPPDSVATRLRTELGWELREVGEFDEAHLLFTRAAQETREIYGDSSPRAGMAVMGVASALHDEGRFDEAEQLFRASLASWDSLTQRPNPAVASALYHLGQLRRLREESVEGEELLRSSMRMRVALHDSLHPELLDATREWGRSLHDLGRLDDAHRVLGDGLRRSAVSLGPVHPVTSAYRTALASVNMYAGRYAESVALYDTAIATQRMESTEHPEMVLLLVRQADALSAAGRSGDAERRYREALGIIERTSGPRSVYRMLALQGLGNTARDAGRLADAAMRYDAADSIAVTELRPDHRYVRKLRRDRALLLLHEGAARAAVTLLESVVADERRILPPAHYEHGWTLVQLGRARLEADDIPGARTALNEGLEHLGRLAPDHAHVRAARSLLRDARMSGS